MSSSTLLLYIILNGQSQNSRNFYQVQEYGNIKNLAAKSKVNRSSIEQKKLVLSLRGFSERKTSLKEGLPL